MTSTRCFKVAAIQMFSTKNKSQNIEKAETFINDAASQGARLIVLPEYFNFRADDNVEKIQNAEPIPGPTSRWGQETAKHWGIYILLGSILEINNNNIYNTAVLVDPFGNIIAKYRKIHLFRACIGNVSYDEASLISAGNEVVVASVDEFKLGITICYDLRFPELYRALALNGANIIAVPSNFTLYTGKDHWEVLLRARAIENQVYVVAAAQTGVTETGRASYGRSMIIDPWGVVISQASDKEGVILANCDFSFQNEIRQKLPSLKHWRNDIFSLLRN